MNIIINPQAGPHVRNPGKVPALMTTVVLALLPATLFGIYLFGWPALNLVLLCIASALAAEALCLRLAGRPLGLFLSDGSALLTALLLALTLPPWAPWWIAVSGGAFAVIVGKQVYGGIGQNPFNPAMVARVALLLSFPVQMTAWVAPAPLFSAAAPDFLTSLGITFQTVALPDGATAASWLGEVKTELSQARPLSTILADTPSWTTLARGDVPGSLGETSALLLLAGGLYLLYHRIISWQLPVSLLATVALLATLTHLIDPERYPHALYHLSSGALMLTAFFIVTDPVTSPSSRQGQLLFGIGCGVLVFVIRSFGGYPEGAAFAVLLMNALTPLIDHYVRPRHYGRTRRGTPLPLPKTTTYARQKPGDAQ